MNTKYYFFIILILILLFGAISYLFRDANGWSYVSAYYIFAGIGTPAAFLAIFVTSQQTQKQITKDAFLKSAEFIIDELYAYTVEISFHWVKTAFFNYAGKFVNATVGFIPGHDNKITLTIHVLHMIETRFQYTPEINTQDVRPYVILYNQKFNTLIDMAKSSGFDDLAKVYEDSYLGKLNIVLLAALRELPNPQVP